MIIYRILIKLLAVGIFLCDNIMYMHILCKYIMTERRSLMRRNLKRILALALGFAIVIGLSPAVKTEAASATKLPTATFYYERSGKSLTMSHTFWFDGFSSLSGIKSSKTGVIKPAGVTKEKYTSDYYTIDSKGNLVKDDDYSYNYVGLTMKILKTGSSNISFKSGKKSYVKTFKVKAYQNPLSSLVISNVNNGKTVHNSFKGINTVAFNSKKATKVSVTAKAKGDWRIEEIKITDTISSKDSEDGTVEAKRTYTNGTQKAVISTNHYNSKYNGSVTISLYNKADGGTMTIYAYINPPSKK